jgi:hypothetical protein
MNTTKNFENMLKILKKEEWFFYILIGDYWLDTFLNMI